LKIGQFDTEKEVLVVAEIGNNHEGSYALAEELVRRAAETGAHAVKFQTFKTEYYVSRKDEQRFSRLKSFELSFDQFERLSLLAKRLGLIFLSTPFDLDSAHFLESIVAAYKISSGDNNFYPLLRSVASTGKPMILSAGLVDISGLRHAKDVIEEVWRERGFDQQLAILHCVTAYPVPPVEANLLAITHLRSEFDCTIGYSDHTLGIDAALLAVALGARIVEKHFTIDKHYSEFRDHQLSADPEELALLVRKVKEAGILLGQGVKKAQESEIAAEPLVRRSVVAKRDLPAGKIVTWDDITWTRPAVGLNPGDEHLILGKGLARAVAAGEPILPEHMKDAAAS
jgi:N,N'-diacetyllegionaminate synthase